MALAHLMEYYRPESPALEKKEFSVFRLTLLGIGCFLVMALAGYFLAGRVRDQLRGPERVVQAHIEAINTGDFQRAYHDFTLQYRNTVSFNAFHSSFGDFIAHIPSQRISLNRVEVSNRNAIVEGLLTGRDGAIVPIHYELIKENGKWRIRRYEWTRPGDLIAL